MSVVKKYQSNFTAGVISPALYGRNDLTKYSSGCKVIVNGVIRPHGGISKRPGTILVDTLPGSGILIPFSYSVTQTHVLAFFDPNPNGAGTRKAKMRIYFNGEVMKSGNTVYEIETPYSPDELEQIKFTQSADVMFLVHKSHAPCMLTRRGYAQWDFTPMNFTPSMAAPSRVTAQAVRFKNDSSYYDVDISYKISAVDDREVESAPSVPAVAVVKSTWTSGARVELSWSAVPGAKRYEVYKNARGYYAWIGSAETTNFIDDNIEGDGKMGPKEYRNPFSGTDEYPGAVGIYQQRLVLGRTNKEPHTVWLSETGAFNSMAVASPLRDDSAITVTVDSRQMNEIRHFIPIRDVLMFTSGAEFHFSAGRNQDAITPSSVSFRPQSYWGCSHVPPVLAGESIIFATKEGTMIRDLKFSLDNDGYTGTEVSILAEHLIDSPVRDWAFQQTPNSTLWICLSNGKLLTLTYMREQEICAWSEQYSSNDKFISVSSINENGADTLYFLVSRNGNYFVEQQQQSLYLDCAKEFTFSNETFQLTGLNHLANKPVAAIVDGVSFMDLEVSPQGTLDLPTKGRIIAVGLPYTTRIETLDPEIKSQEGTTLGFKKVIPLATFQLKDTRGLRVGPDFEHLVEVKSPLAEQWGGTPPLFSGAINVTLAGKHREEATIAIEHPYPLPFTLLSVCSTVSIG